MAARQARKRPGIEQIDAALGLGDHVVLVTPVLQQRHLAEEITLLHQYVPMTDGGNRLAAADEKHGVARVAGADHGNAGQIGAGVEQLGDLGDLALVHAGE